MNSLMIAVDFDGTCVTQDFPEVGRDIGAAPVLRRLVADGHKIILWTMRSGKYLADAISWFTVAGIPLHGANVNPDQGWSTSPKAYANLYIDDAALGCPLKFDKSLSDRPFVDWDAVDCMLYMILKGTAPIGTTTIHMPGLHP